MNIDLKYVTQFKSAIQDIVDSEIKNAGITTYISAIVQKINDDGTVDVYLPPDKDNLITGIFNRCGEMLFVGDSVEIATKNGSLSNAWVFVKHGTNISGYTQEVESLGGAVVLKVVNGRLVTSNLASDPSLGNSLTIISDDINLDGMNINLNGSRGITITSPYFNVTKDGTITSTAGQIGGWTLTDKRLYSGSGSSYVALDSGTSNVNYSIWAGNSTPSSAPFSVTRAGAIKSTSGTIGGWTLSSSALYTANNTLYLGTTGITATIGGTSRSGLVFKSGSNFGVSSTGVLYSNNAIVNGSITATSLSLASDITIPVNNLKSSGLEDYIKTEVDAGNILYRGDVSHSRTVSSDGHLITDTVNFVGANGQTQTYTTYTSTSDGYVYTNVGLGTQNTSTHKTNYVRISKQGLLEADNVLIHGRIYSGEGQIGGWTLSDSALYTANNGFYLGTTGITATIGGVSRSNIVFKAGNNFGVDSSGNLYSNNANLSGATISGAITATSGTFDNCTVNSNCTVPASTITGTLATSTIPNLSAGKITTGTLNGNNVSVINLNADNITGGTVTAANISLNSGTVKLRTNGHVEFTNSTGYFVMGPQYGSVGATTHPYVSALNVAGVANGICFRNSTKIGSPGDSNYATIGVSTYDSSKHSLRLNPGGRLYVDSHYGLTGQVSVIGSGSSGQYEYYLAFWKGILCGASKSSFSTSTFPWLV